jgi:hypothetical protein
VRLIPSEVSMARWSPFQVAASLLGNRIQCALQSNHFLSKHLLDST